MTDDLQHVSSHFAFGENWADFARSIDETRVVQAEHDLQRIVGDLRGKTFLDIGCGSGIHSVAVARLGAKVTAIDLDPRSVETTRAVAQRFGSIIEVTLASVFDIERQFDVVYSWGVLHHTGAMWDAIAHGARLVAPDGRFALALFARTPLCDLWRREKRYYTKSSRPVQTVIRGCYKAAFITALLATGRNPTRYIAQYQTNRGMSWRHDVHDWLGGYPYESASPEQVSAFVEPRGFTRSAQFIHRGPLAGLFGTGCNEYLFTRKPAPSLT